MSMGGPELGLRNVLQHWYGHGPGLGFGRFRRQSWSFFSGWGCGAAWESSQGCVFVLLGVGVVLGHRCYSWRGGWLAVAPTPLKWGFGSLCLDPPRTHASDSVGCSTGCAPATRPRARRIVGHESGRGIPSRAGRPEGRSVGYVTAATN